MLLQPLWCQPPTSSSPPGAGGVCAHHFLVEEVICRFPNTRPGSGISWELGSGAGKPAGTIQLSRAINAGAGWVTYMPS